jgi:hypothetical protein
VMSSLLFRITSLDPLTYSLTLRSAARLIF